MVHLDSAATGSLPSCEMLAWVRGRLRPVAVALLVSLVGVGVVSAAGHGSDCHDDECGALLAHDPSSHRVGSPVADAAHALHCVLCHWTRTVRPSTESAHHLARPVADASPLSTEVFGVISVVQAAQPPLRSPPA